MTELTRTFFIVSQQTKTPNPLIFVADHKGEIYGGSASLRESTALLDIVRSAYEAGFKGNHDEHSAAKKNLKTHRGLKAKTVEDSTRRAYAAGALDRNTGAVKFK